MAQFYYADNELNFVGAELDYFDSRKDPEQCTALASLPSRCQNTVSTGYILFV